MAVLSHFGPSRLILAAFAISLMIAGGCRKAEQIHSYTVPKETKAPVADAAPPANLGEPTDRMLAAILPAGNQAWFFKVVGPIPAIEKREKELNDFFASIKFADDGKPKWTLPADWKEGAGNAMRAATILVPAEGKPLDLSVTVLPWTGTADDLLRNVNRWRGQLQLQPVGAQQVAEFTRETKAGDRPMTIVDLRGHFAGSGMTAPFAGGPAGAAPGLSSSKSDRAAPGAPSSDLPPGHPPIDSGSTPPPIATATPTEPVPPAANDVPKFAAPAEWHALPADGFRKAAFAIGDEQHGAVVTLINFPSTEGQMIGDPLPNVNRWRREVGLSEVKQDELGKTTESIEVDGKPATYVRAVPDTTQPEQSQANQATLAAMVKSGDQIWFIKLKGDRAVVTSQEDAFKLFLKSVRFAADAGATDGNK